MADETGIEALTSVLTSADQRYLREGFIITQGGRYLGLGTGGLGSISTVPTLVFVFTLLLTAILVARKVRGGILIGLVESGHDAVVTRVDRGDGQGLHHHA